MTTELQPAMPLSAAAIQSRIDDARNRILAAQNTHCELAKLRIAPLEQGDYAKLDEVEAQITSNRDIESRERERLEILETRLGQANEREAAAKMDAIAERANRARAIGEKLIQGAYRTHATAIADVLRRLAAIDRLIDTANFQLERGGADARVASPNCCRYRPMSEGTRKVTKRVGIAEPEHPKHHLFSHRFANADISSLTDGTQCPTFMEVEVEERDFDRGDYPAPLTHLVIPDAIPAPREHGTLILWNGENSKIDEDTVRAIEAEIDGGMGTTLAKLGKRILGGAK